jgi:hypothetical protein
MDNGPDPFQWAAQWKRTKSHQKVKGSLPLLNDDRFALNFVTRQIKLKKRHATVLEISKNCASIPIGWHTKNTSESRWMFGLVLHTSQNSSSLYPINLWENVRPCAPDPNVCCACAFSSPFFLDMIITELNTYSVWLCRVGWPSLPFSYKKQTPPTEKGKKIHRIHTRIP